MPSGDAYGEHPRPIDDCLAAIAIKTDQPTHRDGPDTRWIVRPRRGFVDQHRAVHRVDQSLNLRLRLIGLLHKRQGGGGGTHEQERRGEQTWFLAAADRGLVDSASAPDPHHGNRLA